MSGKRLDEENRKKPALEVEENKEVSQPVKDGPQRFCRNVTSIGKSFRKCLKKKPKSSESSRASGSRKSGGGVSSNVVQVPKSTASSSDADATQLTLDDALNPKNKIYTSFSNFLEKQHAEENIEFWVNCEQFKKKNSKAKKFKNEKAKSLFDYYLRPRTRHGPFGSICSKLNVDASVVEITERKINEEDGGCFDHAQAAVKINLEEPFRCFVLSEKNSNIRR